MGYSSLKTLYLSVYVLLIMPVCSFDSLTQMSIHVQVHRCSKYDSDQKYSESTNITGQVEVTYQVVL